MMMKNLKSKWQKISGDRHRADDGFTLLEVLLSLGVITAIIMSLVQISSSWSKSEQERLVARHLAIVTAAAEAFVNNRFDEVFAATAAGAIDLPLDEDISLAHGLYIKENGIFLPNGFNPRNAFGQDVTVIVRRLGVAPNRLEVVVVTEGRRIEDTRLMNVARLLGERGGYITGIARGNCTTTIICSVADSWRTDLANFADTSWRLTNVANTQGGYLASYIGLVESNDGVGPYMYRSRIISNNTAPNTMYANLDMGNNDVLNAGNVVTDTIRATNLNVQGGNLLVDHGLVATGNVNVAGSVTADAVRSATATVTNNIDIGTGGTLNVENLTGSLANIETLNVTSLLNTPNVSAIDVNTGTGTLDLGRVQAAGANIATGTIAPSVLSQTVTANNVSAAGTLTVLSNSEIQNLSLDTMSVENADIDNLNCPSC